MAVCFRCAGDHGRSRQSPDCRPVWCKSKYFKLFTSHLFFMLLGYWASIYHPLLRTSSKLMASSSSSQLATSGHDKQISTCSISETPYSVAFVTIADKGQAEELAGKLVSNKLAACVNITPKITSIYEWKGNMEKDEESLMMIKTKTSLVPRLITFVKANHPYEVCEVIALPIQQGNSDYLKWLGDCLNKEEG